MTKNQAIKIINSANNKQEAAEKLYSQMTGNDIAHYFESVPTKNFIAANDAVQEVYGKDACFQIEDIGGAFKASIY